MEAKLGKDSGLKTQRCENSTIGVGGMEFNTQGRSQKNFIGEAHTTALLEVTAQNNMTALLEYLDLLLIIFHCTSEVYNLHTIVDVSKLNTCLPEECIDSGKLFCTGNSMRGIETAVKQASPISCHNK